MSQVFEKFHEQNITQVNAEPMRSYYIPFRDKNFSMKKEKSASVKMLKKWKFQYFSCFTDSVIQANPQEEFEIPFMWQLKGFDKNRYANFFYPFPYDPPYIRKDNPCGVYSTEYIPEESGEKKYIVFEGVDSCLYLFVNDVFVGYSTVSHCQAEFDITKYLVYGEKNVIKVIVLKWCSGSYFEDQDKLRMSGIFRDVYILSRPAEHLRDYKITTNVENGNGIVELRCDKPVKVSLYNGNVKLQEQEGKMLSFCVKNAKLWSSETPNLYKLVISYGGEYFCEYTGIRRIEIRDGIFTLNGKPIKMKGVNRHSMTPEGYAESYEWMEKDVRMFKENNINAVRTSHYPPDPYFLQLCDHYGIYVIDEADLETHGLGTVHYNGNDEHWNDLAENREYLPIYLHRQARMYEQDKNRQCILLWSLGNESGWGENFKECIRYFHRVDSRPVHYEGCRKLTDTVFREVELLDVASCMYASPQECVRRIEQVKMPFMLCEYSHAMGNSCGDVKEYWDIIYARERFFGAFVWEWCNHTVITQDGKVLYGGDFGEREPVHSSEGNFCVDGLVDTDRRPHPALGEVKQVYAPVDVYGDAKKFTVENRRDFLSLDDLRCLAIKKVLGKETERREIDISGIAARGKKTFSMPFCCENVYTSVDFLFLRKDESVCAQRQIVLCDKYPLQSGGGAARIERQGNFFRISGNGYSAMLDRCGILAELEREGEKILRKPMRLQLYRAPVDNDGPFLYEWESCRLPYAVPYPEQITMRGNTVRVHGKVVADIVEPLYDFDLIYTAYETKLQIDFRATKRDWVQHVPRIGFALEFDDAYEKVKFFGRGIDEAYEDRKMNCPIGLYEGTVKTMNYEYVKPQESGSHCGSRMVCLRAHDGKEIVVESERDFSFSVSPYTYGDYKKHRHDMLNDTGKTVLSVDYRMAGVGSAACGPVLDPKYRVKDKEIQLKFDIRFLK